MKTPTETGKVCWRCKANGSTSLGSFVYRANEPSVGTFVVTSPSGRIRNESLCADHLRRYQSPYSGWKVA